MSGKIVLVLGGARSGKSRFAERYATCCGGAIAYIATAEAGDEEMRRRIALHRQRRPAEWRTWEAPLAAEKAISAAAAEADVILFDCLTIYVANLMLAPDVPGTAASRQEYILAAVDGLLMAARQCGATVIFVANEVGMGIVPDNPLSREYRDLAGWVNQRVAAAADEVYLVVAGLAVEIKQVAWMPPGEAKA